MDRRQYLAGLVAALAGCTARPSTGGQPTKPTTTRSQTPTDPTQTPTERGLASTPSENPTDIPSEMASPTERTQTANGGPPARFRTVTLIEVVTDDVPEDHEIAIGVDILENEITAHHTARIRPVFINTGSAREFDGFGLDAPFDPSTRPEPQGWFLLPAASRRERTATDCWGVEEIPDWGGGARNVRLHTGEAVTQELELWSDPGADECMPPGEYRFQASYSLGDDNDNTSKYTWSFTLDIDELN